MVHLLTLYKSWRYAASIGFSDNCLHVVHSCSLPSSSDLERHIKSGVKSFTRGVLLPSVHHRMPACANCCACIGMKIFALHPNDCVVCYKVLPSPLLHLLRKNGFYFLVFSSTNECIMMVFVQCLCLVGDQICPVTGQYMEKDAGSRPHLYLNKSNSILS
jgi:hypothetical protein